jgi:hydroxypyruvate isomerase
MRFQVGRMNHYLLDYSVCIETMFLEYDPIDRVGASAACGLKDLEIWFWTAHDLNRLEEKTREYGSRLIIMNAASTQYPGITDELWQGILSSHSDAATLEAVEETIGVCKRFGCERLLLLPGNKDENLTYAAQWDRLSRVVSDVATLLEKHGITLILEPLNTYTRPNCFISRAQDGFRFLRQLGHPNVFLLYDIFHQQQMEGNLTKSLRENMPLIGHIHIADVPDRLPPGKGEVNFHNILTTIHQTGYRGFTGLEYFSREHTEDTLGFLI